MVADGSVPGRFFLGIATEDIENGGDGYVTSFGKVRGVNTSSFTEGSVLWCNPAVAGGLTSTEPAAPNLKLAVAFVVSVHANNGTLAVRSETGIRVSDASDVQITSVANNDLLQYNTETSRWENVAGTTTNIGEGTNLYFTNERSRAALSAGTGITYNNTTGVITNAEPDQVVALTASTGISVTGTYPNFTIENTSPSSGGTITGSGTTNYLSKWTGGTALGDSLVFDNGTNVGIGTTSPGAKLDVNGNISASSTNPKYYVTRGDGTYVPILQLESSTDDIIIGATSIDAVRFVDDSGEAMRLDGSGNLGIGTTSPSYKLDVEGDVGINDYIQHNGDKLKNRLPKQ
jgi:hypothetical protein